MTRHFLRLVCRALIGVVLLAQMAISAYACPMQAALAPAAELGSDERGVVDSPVASSMANCDDMAGAMDPSFGNLCAEHCHYGQQSDHAATLTVPAALLNALYVTPAPTEPVVLPRAAAAAQSALVSASPPHAILHCCFRI